MALTPTQDRAALAAFLRQKAALNTYAIGDLDDAFWPHTDFFALQHGPSIQEVALLYKGIDPPILVAYQNSALAQTRQLLSALLPQLPEKVYCHLTAGLLDLVEARYAVEDHGEHFIMELTDPDIARSSASKLSYPSPQGKGWGWTPQPLSLDHLDEMRAFFDTAHPDHWFHRPMLEHGLYMGIRDESGALVSVGGTHVYSPHYRVATLGNVVTAPTQRGRGLGTHLTAALCQALLPEMDTIGLNVRVDNAAALRVYQKLGFEIITNYWEMMLTER